MQTRPYPFDSWPKFSRAHLRALARLRSHIGTPQYSAALGCASTLLGAPVEVTNTAAETLLGAALGARLAALGPCALLVLEVAQAGLDDLVLLELSGSFAERLVDRTLGGDTPALTPSGLPIDELSQGALAYLAARCLAAVGGRLRLRHVLTDVRALGEVLNSAAWLALTCEVRIGDEAGSARVYARAAMLTQGSARALRELPELPLTLVAEVGRAALPRSELASLRQRDIIVLDACALQRDAGRWLGSVAVHVLGSRTHLVCQIRDQRLQVERHCRATEPAMTTGRVSQPASNPELGTLALDAPLEIHVELARFSVTLGELQRMTAGDVLQTGQRIGEAVTLRVAGRAIARGELVDVEGEVGVRVTQFLDAG